MVTGAKRNRLTQRLVLPISLTFSCATGNTVRRLAAILVWFLVTDGVPATAAALCAPSMCPMKAKVCCCHQSSATGISTHSAVLKKPRSSCCEVSSSTHGLPGETLPKLTVETFKLQFDSHASDLVLVASEFPPDPSSSGASAFDFHPDRSDTYPHSSLLRI